MKMKKPLTKEIISDDFEDDDESDLFTSDMNDDDEIGTIFVSHGCHLVKGKQGHAMEDYVVSEIRKVDGHELGLYAIFDGHSGLHVAEYLQRHLFDNILDEPDLWTNTEKAIKRAYMKTEEEILDRVVAFRGVSTAVTAMIVDNEKLVVSNVGDSRAVICKKGKAKQISEDHEPKKEKHVIEKRGGFVSEKPGNVPRVDGQLAMARAFGDPKLKEHITSEPDVYLEIIDIETEYLILASEGLWKVMSNQEAVDCIKDMKDPQEAAEELVAEAQDRKSLDDISCIVVMFN